VGRLWSRILTWAVAVVVVGGVAALVVGHLRGRATQAAPQYFVVPVTVGPVAVTVSGTGSLVPQQTLTVAPEVSGTVSQVLVHVGQTVRAGQPLFALADTQGLAQQVTADEASLANAESQLQNLVHPAVDPRTIEEDRLKVDQAQLSLQQAEATLANAEEQYRQATRVAAGVAGTVEAVDVVPGQSVGAGTVLAVVAPDGAPVVTVPVPEAELPYLPVGARAAVTLTQAPGQVLPGRVAAVSVPTGGQGAGASAASGQGGAAAAPAAGTALPCPGTSGAALDVSVAVEARVRLVPGSTASVVFTPVGDPPACDTWDLSGTVAAPTPVTLVAGQPGTVERVLAAGTAVRPDTVVAVLASPAAQATVQQDAMQVAQDRYAWEQAQLALEQAEQPEPPTPEAVAAAELQVAQAKAALAHAEQELAALTVRAPMSGIVTAVNVSPTQTVQPATQAVTLASDGPLVAEADVDELSIADVHVGQLAEVQVPAYPNRTFPGRVVSISPVGTSQGGLATFLVDVALGDDPGLLAGMSDTVNITVATAPEAIRVPAQAVTLLPGGHTGIVRVMQNGRPVPVRVQVGLVGQDYTQILSGLEPGEPVVAGEASTGTTGFAAFFRGGPAGPRRGGAAFRLAG
jgi:RND family efflux transporter MFP subunit